MFDDAIHSLRERLSPKRENKVGNILKVAAGTAAAVFVVLQLRRELYGPGGTKMYRYDPDVDQQGAERGNARRASDDD